MCEACCCFDESGPAQGRKRKYMYSEGVGKCLMNLYGYLGHLDFFQTPLFLKISLPFLLALPQGMYMCVCKCVCAHAHMCVCSCAWQWEESVNSSWLHRTGQRWHSWREHHQGWEFCVSFKEEKAIGFRNEEAHILSPTNVDYHVWKLWIYLVLNKERRLGGRERHSVLYKGVDVTFPLKPQDRTRPHGHIWNWKHAWKCSFILGGFMSRLKKKKRHAFRKLETNIARQLVSSTKINLMFFFG